MNYVESLNTKVCFINLGARRQKPIYAEYARDYGYDMYLALEYGKTYVKSTDFVYRTGLLKRKAK